jgi:hypothetical protein
MVFHQQKVVFYQKQLEDYFLFRGEEMTLLLDKTTEISLN